MFGMACICHSSLHTPRIPSTLTYDIPILPEACLITQWPTGKPGDGITIWWCHHTRTVCIHHTLVPGGESYMKRQIKCACGYTSIRTNHALHECVAVLDGYHQQTITPSKKGKKYIMCGHYYTSQLCILIEMAFGLTVKRWSILQRPITIAIHSIRHFNRNMSKLKG